MEYLISQFADDASICLDGSRESFENVIKIHTEFALWSGLKINYDKSCTSSLVRKSERVSYSVFAAFKTHVESNEIQRTGHYIFNRPRNN